MAKKISKEQRDRVRLHRKVAPRVPKRGRYKSIEGQTYIDFDATIAVRNLGSCEAGVTNNNQGRSDHVMPRGSRQVILRAFGRIEHRSVSVHCSCADVEALPRWMAVLKSHVGPGTHQRGDNRPRLSVLRRPCMRLVRRVISAQMFISCYWPIASNAVYSGLRSTLHLEQLVA
jgi:hypothetical protein